MATRAFDRKALKNRKGTGTPQRGGLRKLQEPYYHCARSLRERAIALAERNEIFRAKELEAIGVPRQFPLMMCREGHLIGAAAVCMEPPPTMAGQRNKARGE